ncbi:LamG-like jellyroll fold domain-containing protein [Spartinivicinus marinus]|uniref:LamG-like jellyroll fold domain-containing protein n=1 Tax=Spartinivicinus marinus TaxID=2994442 RepID=UPI0022564D01|nr:LamG-like jellyroll fold domain-containing protein [Spartinivicinus marinus]MCX4028256.1 LamG domain-containing protein [Spartinivicinus marinus]
MLLKRLFSLAAAIFGLSQLPAYGLNPNGFEQGIHSGYVFARAIVKDKSGYPLWAEYNQAGGHTRIPVSGEQAAQSQVISGNTYRNFIKQYDDLKKLYNNQVELLPINQYNSFRNNNSLNSALNQPIKNLPLLPADTKVVAIPALQHRGVTDGEQLVIKSFPVDLLNYPTIDDNIQSLLIAENGEILYQSQNRIGYLTAFGTKKEGDQVEDSSEYKSSSISGRLQSFFAPIPGVSIESVTGYVNGYGVTDENGRYTTSYRVSPCPGFSYSPTVHSYTRLYYSNFNPRGKPTVPYYIQKQSYDLCDGRSAYINSTSIAGLMSHIDSQAATSLIPDNITRIDIPVAVHLISGQVIFNNVEITEDRTTYTAEASPETLMLQEGLDYDGDGTKDRIVRGKINPDDGLFVDDAEGDLQGVYLSSNDRGNGKPNFTKLIDKQSHTTPQGLLKTISKEDLANTDIYVFRESTGELITERVGLSDNEAKLRKETGISKNNNFYYQMMVRSPEDSFSIKRRLYDNWSDWQAKNKMNPALFEHKADHLRTGEPIRVIAINRATGYIGTALTTLGSTQAGGNITSPVPTIIMSPPNLKVWATRRYQPQGIKANGDAERHNIGNEGAALTSDYIIEVHTEWLDENDRPLPAELEGRGYTARLAKIVQDPSNSDDPLAASQIHEIAIDPGRRLQLVKFTEGNAGNFHYYFQVNGNPIDRENDFSSNPDHDGVLKYRPKTYVPLQVQLYDEKHTLARKAELQRIDKEDEFEPIYHWVYRPELQFSVYDLEIDAIRRKTGDDKTVNIYGEEIPVISGSDNALEVAFDLISPAFNQLETIDGKREFVLAMGEQEYGFEVKREGSEQTIIFNNIEHLSEIEPEDYLTLRLFLNNDASNILWEYAFEYLSIDHLLIGNDNEDEDTIYLSADNPTLPLQAYLVGYATRKPENKQPVTVIWSNPEKTGSFSKAAETDNNHGVFATDFTMKPVSGLTATVTASLQGITETTASLNKKIKVIPGKPAKLSVKESGKPEPLGLKQWTIEATVYDAHDNLVADGSDVKFSLSGQAKFVHMDSGTTNGKAKAIITGNGWTDDNITISVSAGGVTETLQSSTSELIINLDVPNNLYTAHEYPVSIRVATANGQPAANVPVDLSSTFAHFKPSLVTTNHQGIATATMMTPLIAGKGSIYAKAGYAGYKKLAIQINPTVDSSLDMEQALITGDVAQDGYAPFQRYDGVKLGVGYKAQHTISILGQANGKQKVSLGDVFDPNLSPLAAYYMNQLDTDEDKNLAPDETGHFPALAENITIAKDHILGRGHSYAFTGGDSDSQIRLLKSEPLQKSTATGFRLEFKASKAGGALVDLAKGQTLQLASDNKLVYWLKTDTGIYKLESAPITLNEWHTVAVRYYQNKVELYVDDLKTAYQAVAEGNINYRGQQLQIGSGYQGLINSLRFYDWNSAPLVTIGDATTHTASLNAEGKTQVVVQSTGQMNTDGKSIRILRIGINAGETRQYLSLISKDAYTQLAGQYIETAYQGGPPINIAGWDTVNQPAGSMPLQFFMSQAHAAWWDFSLDDVYDALKEVASWVVPFEEFEQMILQLGYLVDGDERFDPVSLTINGLIVASAFPVAKPIQGILKVLKPFIKKPANRKMIKMFAEVLGDGVKYAVHERKLDKLAAIVPFVLTVGEILSDEESRKAIPLFISTLSSAEDLSAWIQYLALPANGWEGDTIPSVMDGDEQAYNHKLPLSFMVKSAYASSFRGPRYTARRVAAKAIAKVIREVVEIDGARARLLKEPKDLSRVLKQIVDNINKTQHKEFKRFLFKKSFLKGCIIAYNRGISRLREFIRGRDKTRVDPRWLIGSMVILEEAIVNNKITEEIAVQVHGLMADAFIGSNSQRAQSTRYGARFHLLEAAYWYLNPNYEIVSIEGIRDIHFFIEDTDGEPSIFTKKPYNRTVDIILKRKGHKKETWAELKSKKHPFKKSEFKEFKIKSNIKGKHSIHKEFFADFTAYNYIEDLLDTEKVSSNIGFIWRFHHFKVKRNAHNSIIEQGPDKKDLSNAREWLCKPAKAKDIESIFKATFNIDTSEKVNNQCKKYHSNDIQRVKPEAYFAPMLVTGDWIKDLQDEI